MTELEHHASRAEESSPPLHELLDAVLARAPTRATRREITRLVALHGTSAYHYLMLPDVDPLSPALAEDFENAFVGIFGRREHLILDTIEAMGWAEPVRNLIHEWAIPPGVLTFDHDLIWEHLQDMYTLIDDHGELYVFHR